MNSPVPVTSTAVVSTIPSMKLGLATYKDLIDIKGIKKLSGIKVSGKTVRIGATTNNAEVASSKEVGKIRVESSTVFANFLTIFLYFLYG